MGQFELEAKLNSEQQAVVATAEKFAREVLRPAGIELDKLAPGEVVQADSSLRSVYRKYHELGFHRLIIPKALAAWRSTRLPGTSSPNAWATAMPDCAKAWHARWAVLAGGCLRHI
jgi:alkylation response protein AidB-like acyl-CoA dehydrogenase